jgi:hypothetical protein
VIEFPVKIAVLGPQIAEENDFTINLYLMGSVFKF